MGKKFLIASIFFVGRISWRFICLRNGNIWQEWQTQMTTNSFLMAQCKYSDRKMVLNQVKNRCEFFICLQTFGNTFTYFTQKMTWYIKCKLLAVNITEDSRFAIVIFYVNLCRKVFFIDKSSIFYVESIRNINVNKTTFCFKYCCYCCVNKTNKSGVKEKPKKKHSHLTHLCRKIPMPFVMFNT